MDFTDLQKRIQKSVKKRVEKSLEDDVLDEFRVFGLDGAVIKTEDNFYYFLDFSVYFWFKESERISLKSLFSNPDSNFLVRLWVDVAKRIKDEDKRMHFILVFTKNELPLMVIFPRFLLDIFGLDESKFSSYLVFYSGYVGCSFVVCKLREFLRNLAYRYV